MTRASKEIYLNVDKLNTLPDAEAEKLEPTDRLLLQTEHEHVNIPIGMLQDFVSGDFTERAEELEDRADDLEDRIEAIEAGGGGGGTGDGPDKFVNWEQVNPDVIWTIVHNLNKFPSVTVIDSAGTVVVGAVSYPDLNTIQIEFAGAMAGRAFLN